MFGGSTANKTGMKQDFLSDIFNVLLHYGTETY